IYRSQRMVVAELLKDARHTRRKGDKRQAAALFRQASQEKRHMVELGRRAADAREQAERLKQTIRKQEDTFRRAAVRALEMKSRISRGQIAIELAEIDQAIEWLSRDQAGEQGSDVDS